MKAIKSAGAITLAIAFSACALQPPSAPPPPKIVTEAAPKPAASPLPTGAQLLAQQPDDVQEAIKDHRDGGKWPIYENAQTVLYPYGGSEPIVDCAPLRTTDIQLEPGETITDVAMGDTERWMATPAASGDPRNPVPHLAVKPQIAGSETNLTIYTTKHIYHLILRARGHAMQEVEFYYPEELLAQMEEADAAASRAKQEAVDPPSDSSNVVRVTNVDPAQLNFAYTVDGSNVPWKPIRAFDDGAHVYILMPSGMKTSEAPALLIAAGNGTQMANYRVEGSYYVVDRLFNHAILVSGVGRQQDRVTISYAGQQR